MIGDLIGIYRARRDPRTAAKLAARFAQGQLFDRLTAPLLVPLVLLWVVIVVGGILAALAIWGSIALHGAVGFLGVIPAAIAYAAFRIQAGLRGGLEAVKALAEGYADRGLDRIIPDAEPPTALPD